MTKAQTIAAMLNELNTDALLVTSDVNRRYVTGFASSAGVAVITAGKCWFFTDFRYIEAARNKVAGFEIEQTGKQNKYPELILAALSEVGAKTVAFEDERMTVAELERWKKLIDREFLPCGDLFTRARRSKTDDEIETMIAAQRIAERALDDVLPLIKPSVSEKRIAAELIYHMMKHGAQGPSFDPIVVSGVNSSMPHGVPSDKAIEDGDFVTMDFGCKFGDYCSDMTRTVAVGHATDEMRKVYDTVLQAQFAGLAASKAGVKGGDIDAAARKVIEDAGYGQYFGHSYGHSLGLEIHEAPNAAPGADDLMPEGAVVSAEPGIYIPGKFGVRIEDVVVMRDDGCQNITHAPKELLVL